MKDRPSEMINVILYRQQNSESSDAVKAILNDLQKRIPHVLVEIDIDSNLKLKAAYGRNIPVVQAGPYKLASPISQEALEIMLQTAVDRERQIEKVNQINPKSTSRDQTLEASDRLSLWISKYYIHIFNLFLLVYVGLPFLAPVLMKQKMDLPARAIYTVYSGLCHQLTFRSYFLFGEQLFYPRELSGVTAVTSYEQWFFQTEVDIQFARDFVGDEKTGYKIAICQRDIGIYGSMLLFGVLFSITGRRIKSLPWYLWVIIGILPMGLDGGSQLPSLISGIPFELPFRESNPFLRSVTGVLFGVTTSWYLYPLIEETMRETRRIVEIKMLTILKTSRKDEPTHANSI